MNKKGGVLKNEFVTVSARIVGSGQGTMSFRSFRCDPNIDFAFPAVGDVAAFSTGLLMNRYIHKHTQDCL